MRRKIGLNGFGAQILHKLLSFGQIHDTRDTLGNFYFILFISLFDKKNLHGFNRQGRNLCNKIKEDFICIFYLGRHVHLMNDNSTHCIMPSNPI